MLATQRYQQLEIQGHLIYFPLDQAITSNQYICQSIVICYILSLTFGHAVMPLYEALESTSQSMPLSLATSTSQQSLAQMTWDFKMPMFYY